MFYELSSNHSWILFSLGQCPTQHRNFPKLDAEVVVMPLHCELQPAIVVKCLGGLSCLVRRVSTDGNQLTNDLMAAQTTKQNIEPTSGPDQDGPIWGYHFVPNQPARSITSEEAVRFLFLTAPSPGRAE